MTEKITLKKIYSCSICHQEWVWMMKRFYHPNVIMNPSELFQLYTQSIDKCYESFDMSACGSNQKSFHLKYNDTLYSLALYLMCTQITPLPSLITLQKHDGYDLYYSDKGIHCGDIIAPLQPIHHIAIKNIMDDCPTRIYLFNTCTVPPAQLTNKNKVNISNYFTRFIKSCNNDLNTAMFKNKAFSTQLLCLLIRENIKMRQHFCR